MRMVLARCALGLLATGWLLGPALAAPSYADVKAAYRASDLQVLDRNGVLLQRIRADDIGATGRKQMLLCGKHRCILGGAADHWVPAVIHHQTRQFGEMFYRPLATVAA